MAFVNPYMHELCCLGNNIQPFTLYLAGQYSDLSAPLDVNMVPIKCFRCMAYACRGSHGC